MTIGLSLSTNRYITKKSQLDIQSQFDHPVHQHFSFSQEAPEATTDGRQGASSDALSCNTSS